MKVEKGIGKLYQLEKRIEQQDGTIRWTTRWNNREIER
jgi:hypothetical protein